MSVHLSSRQIDAYILGEPNLETEQHLAECAACQDEIARLGQTMAAFRASAHQWSEREMPARQAIVWDKHPSRRWTPFSGLSVAFVAMAICVLIVISLPWHSQRPSASQAAADAELLSQVEAEVSRTVPGPMEPLTEFLSNDSSKPDAQVRAAQKKARP